MKSIELAAAEALLNRRLKLTLPAPRWMRLFGVRTIPFYAYRPTVAMLLRMSGVLAAMDIDLAQLKSGRLADVLTVVSRNGKRASRLVALGMIRGSVASLLFHRLLAFYLRCTLDMCGLAELTQLLAVTSWAAESVSIIVPASGLRMTDPSASLADTGSKRGNGSTFR